MVFLQEFDIAEFLAEFVVCGDLEQVLVHAVDSVEYGRVNSDGDRCGALLDSPDRSPADIRPFGDQSDGDFAAHAGKTDLLTHLFENLGCLRQQRNAFLSHGVNKYI